MKTLEEIGIGATLEEAKADALKKLDISEDLVEFEIIQEPEKKLFGLMKSEAKVKAFAKIADTEEINEKLKSFLINLLMKYDIKDLQVELEEGDEVLKFNVSGDDLGIAIGYRGETLSAIQYILGLVANKEYGSFKRVLVEMGTYRAKRDAHLRTTAERMANKVLKYKRSFSLEPMNSYERRIIHTVVQDIDGVKSWSEGERYRRHVIIGLDDEA